MDAREIFKVAQGIPGEFQKGSMQLLWDCLEQLPHHPTVVEVGVEYGRSSSIILGWGVENPAAMLFVDARLWNAEEGRTSWLSVLEFYQYSRTVLDFHPAYGGPAWYGVSPGHRSSYHYAEGYSHDIAEGLPQYRPHLLHIDGDHTAEGVAGDSRWLRLLHPGGIALFHDYRAVGGDGKTPTFPGYSEAIDLATPNWEILGLSNTLLALRKPYDAAE